MTLSHFRASRTDTGGLLEWTTESELDNAGFNILRSETEHGTFVKINATLIPGNGTTAERQTLHERIPQQNQTPPITTNLKTFRSQEIASVSYAYVCEGIFLPLESRFQSGRT